MGAAAPGLSENAAGAIAYLTIIPAIVFLVMEPYNRSSFIRFHAFQCLGIYVVGAVVAIFTGIPLIGWILGPLMMLGLLVVWLFCILKASQGVKFKLPLLGQLAENMAK